MDVDDVIQWLRAGEDREAADLLSQCDFSWDYVDTAFAISGDQEIDIFELNIHAPRRILSRVSTDLQPQAKVIEGAIQECSRVGHKYISDIHWVPKLRGEATSPSDPEVETVLATLDSDHIRVAWNKALSRRQSDPAGAITAAKTLVESVCKHMLTAAGVRYPANSDVTNLYYLLSKQLRLSPDQHIDKNLKQVLDSCAAIVSGIAFIRNNLGDAHSSEPAAAATTSADAELAVNLAGAVAMFLVRNWDGRKGQHTNEVAPGEA